MTIVIITFDSRIMIYPEVKKIEDYGGYIKIYNAERSFEINRHTIKTLTLQIH